MAKRSTPNYFRNILIEEEEKEKRKLKELKEKFKTKTFMPEDTVKAFLISFKGHPELTRLTFGVSRSQAKYNACTYYLKSSHPLFPNDEARKAFFYSANSKRIPELDKYAKEKVVPVLDFIKYTGLKVPCGICGKHEFSYEDYENSRCFLLKGEIVFDSVTTDAIVCYECKRKLTS